MILVLDSVLIVCNCVLDYFVMDGLEIVDVWLVLVGYIILCLLVGVVVVDISDCIKRYLVLYRW